jgi:iron-sulfur cluster assembly protein
MTLTDAAVERVTEIVENAEDGALGIRVGVKNGGCAGMEYTVDLARDAVAGDDQVEAGDHIVFIDPKAMLFLLGTRLDYEVTKLRSGFVFNNPNQTSACGCGESVTLAPAELPSPPSEVVPA